MTPKVEDVPVDPIQNKQNSLGKMRKPMIKKSAARKSTRPTETKNRKNAEIDKRSAALLQQKQKLESQSNALRETYEKLRDQNNLTEQERDRMQALWEKSSDFLRQEKNNSANLEKHIHKMRTSQTERVNKLQQKMRCLVLNGRVQRVAATQTDIFSTSEGSCKNIEVQTEVNIDREKARSMLRDSDELLTALIAEIEKEKLAAQSELKFAQVQLEARLMENHNTEMNRLRDEKERQAEELVFLHTQQINALESSHDEERASLEGRVQQLQADLVSTNEQNSSLVRSLESVRGNLTETARQLGKAETQRQELTKKVARLEEYKRTHQRDIDRVSHMRADVEKYKELNEILMAEYNKLEKDRDDLAEEFERCVTRVSGVSAARSRHLDARIQKARGKL